LKRKKPSWQVKDQDRKPPEKWRVEYDQNGKVGLIEEMVPPAILPSAPVRPSTRSRFKMRLTEEVLVGGHPCPAGCRVICFADEAANLIGSGKIEQEERNAF
jgi:hypothetical protein